MVSLGIAGDCDRVAVLVPAGERTSSPFSRGVAAEVAGLGGRAVGVFIGVAALTAFGGNPLNPTCRVPSAWAGREQGRRQAAAVAAFLDG
jgi:NTE family protein